MSEIPEQPKQPQQPDSQSTAPDVPPTPQPPAYAPPLPPQGAPVTPPQGFPAAPPQGAPVAPPQGAPGYLSPSVAPSYSPPVYAPPAPRSKSPLPLILGIVGGGVLLIAIVITTAVMFLGGTTGTTHQASDQTAPVGEYLTALAEGDADTALSYLEVYQEKTMLTDGVLTRSQELAPISNIVVDEESLVPAETEYDEARVTASFDIAGKTVTREFILHQDYSTEKWKISNGLESLSLSAFTGLDPSVNGKPVSDSYVAVFLGAYEITLGVEAFELASDTDFIVVASPEQTEDTYMLKATLTEKATDQFRSLVRASLDECLAMTSLNTPCGMDLTLPFSSGEQAIDGTVKRSLRAEGDAALNKLEPRPDFSVPSVVSTSDSIGVSITAEADVDGARHLIEVVFGAYLLSPKVDFAAAEPKVVWE